MSLYACAIAAGSALLFLIQPIVLKALLPRFGGAAGVWVAGMLFFQVALLLGYFYSYAIARGLAPRLQAGVHLVVLVLSLGFLPIGVVRASVSTSNPSLSIVTLLAVSVGPSYLLLSANSPLLQAWYAAPSGARFPYRLFAVSNAASLLALLSYPVAVERLLSGTQQLRIWSGAYFGWAILVAVLASRTALQPSQSMAKPPEPLGRTPILWIALAACASTLWLAVANHLSQEVAPIPLLWVLPLTLYLLSFVLCFGRTNWYRPSIFRWLLPLAWFAICYRMAFRGSAGGLAWEIPIFAAALFVCCMFCHGELARTRPDPHDGLPFFYLMVALGGALGAVFVALAAPNLFSTYLELPIGIAACVLLGVALLYGASTRRLVRMAVLAVAAFVVASQFQSSGAEVIRRRNFYGALQVADSGAGDLAVRSLYNGKTIHGLQFLAPARSRTPTTYYGVDSGAALALRAAAGSPHSVGIVGLGAGTLAAYGRSGDRFRFYEINPAVVDVAWHEFRFLSESAAAVSVLTGDGRLLVTREPAATFDVLVLDAFSDDAIPVHLLTREAFAMDFERLRPGDILAVHITNRYLTLDSLVQSLADELHKYVLIVHSAADPERRTLDADWALLSDGSEALPVRSPMMVRRIRPWTDDYSDLFQVLK
ncbi:MAG TPA: fused MFS/spermidine synthase [Bryobacteraceae bacterium]